MPATRSGYGRTSTAASAGRSLPAASSRLYAPPLSYDQYIALASQGPPQDRAAFEELAAALDALFTCHNPGISVNDFGDLDQFFVPPTPTAQP